MELELEGDRATPMLHRDCERSRMRRDFLELEPKNPAFKDVFHTLEFPPRVPVALGRPMKATPSRNSELEFRLQLEKFKLKPTTNRRQILRVPHWHWQPAPPQSEAVPEAQAATQAQAGALLVKPA